MKCSRRLVLVLIICWPVTWVTHQWIRRTGVWRQMWSLKLNIVRSPYSKVSNMIWYPRWQGFVNQCQIDIDPTLEYWININWMVFAIWVHYMDIARINHGPQFELQKTPKYCKDRIKIILQTQKRHSLAITNLQHWWYFKLTKTPLPCPHGQAMWSLLCVFFRRLPLLYWGHIVHGPLTRYIKLWFVHAPGMPGTFSLPPISKETTS